MRVPKLVSAFWWKARWWGCWALDKLFYGRLDRYLAWCRYEVGFTGVGPTAFDKKPEFPKPWMPKWVARAVAEAMDIERDIRRTAFRESVMEVLGEDPDDWGLTEEEFEAKYAKAEEPR